MYASAIFLDTLNIPPDLEENNALYLSSKRNGDLYKQMLLYLDY